MQPQARIILLVMCMLLMRNHNDKTKSEIMMRRLFTLFLMFVPFLGFSQESKSTFTWDLEKEREHNANRNAPNTWDTEKLEMDKQVPPSMIKPMAYGAFPVPKYDLIDNNFSGLASGGEWSGIEVQGKKVVYLSMQYATKVEEIESKTFFSLLVLTDSIAEDGYSHMNVLMNSRNHPHYSGEGYIKTKANSIDFVAFQTADDNAYAFVNMRLFDLRIGRIVLVAPQKDGSLRSLQIESPLMSADKMDEYVKEMLKSDKKVIEFFTASGNI